ncbi:MAG: hypothetical protein ACRC18_06825 [Cetobacterium sp.]
MKKQYQTYVISAFPGCGKSYCFKNHQDGLTILDSDSSEFSWVKDENGNNTKERNPDFPMNYIKHIKENMGKVDIILVSSHEEVRKALYDSGIKAIIVYPSKSMKYDFIERYKQRGNDAKFIDFISNNFDKFIDDIENENYGFLKEQLHKDGRFISERFLWILFDNSMGNLCSYWSNR